MRILTAIDQPQVARAILDCLGLNSRAPPLAPASPPERIVILAADFRWERCAEEALSGLVAT